MLYLFDVWNPVSAAEPTRVKCLSAGSVSPVVYNCLGENLAVFPFLCHRVSLSLAVVLQLQLMRSRTNPFTEDRRRGAVRLWSAAPQIYGSHGGSAIYA